MMMDILHVDDTYTPSWRRSSPCPQLTWRHSHAKPSLSKCRLLAELYFSLNRTLTRGTGPTSDEKENAAVPARPSVGEGMHEPTSGALSQLE